MDRTASAAHAAHDELLIARLFGGDVGDSERETAVELMGACPDCAALFADLGSIAAATSTMPVPVRPRDFSLTEADATRLRRARSAGWTFAGLRRSLGGAVAALGFVGIVVTGAVSVFGSSGPTSTNLAYDTWNAQGRVASAPQFGAAASPAADLSLPSGAVPAATQAAMAAAQTATDRPVAVSGTGGGKSATAAPPVEPAPAESAPAGAAAASFAPVPAASSYIAEGPVAWSGSAASGAGSAADGATGRFSNNQHTDRGGMDARLVWLFGFGALFVIGLGVLLVPAALSRRRPRS
ncbi:MAG TPA: hypothetical protein VF337_02315 [Candidatus Limnocylindrales bacterium]